MGIASAPTWFTYAPKDAFFYEMMASKLSIDQHTVHTMYDHANYAIRVLGIRRNFHYVGVTNCCGPQYVVLNHSGAAELTLVRLLLQPTTTPTITTTRFTRERPWVGDQRWWQ
uniref:FGGY_N domain-containing protein n=1 Tax=Mesocestoides corti TaxID=53468 RepID=A0A5K3FZD4_MESCO